MANQLIRGGTTRNEIYWGGIGKVTYLNRTASGRNDIRWYNVTSNGTWLLLQRVSSDRNGIAWNNVSFNFFTDLTGAPSITNGLLHNNGRTYNFGIKINYGDNGSVTSERINFQDMTNFTVSGNRYDFRPLNYTFYITTLSGLPKELFCAIFPTSLGSNYPNSWLTYMKNYSTVKITTINSRSRTANLGSTSIRNFSYNGANYYIAIIEMNGSSYYRTISSCNYADFS